MILRRLISKEDMHRTKLALAKAILRRIVLGDRHVRSASDLEGVGAKRSMDEDSACEKHGLE